VTRLLELDRLEDELSDRLDDEDDWELWLELVSLASVELELVSLATVELELEDEELRLLDELDDDDRLDGLDGDELLEDDPSTELELDDESMPLDDEDRSAAGSIVMSVGWLV
jgi:hypothetical protein